MFAYINQFGKLENFRIDDFEFIKLLNISNKDVQEILKAFYYWSGYLPHESKDINDFSRFVKYALKDKDLKIKAAAILNLYMLV